MNLLNAVREKLIKNLWSIYKKHVPNFQVIESGLLSRNNGSLILDHFAIIDLPGSNSGISNLCQIFSALEYRAQGSDYLHDKQNDFLWMVEIEAIEKSAINTLPQIVIADFRLEELSSPVRKVIRKYTDQIPESPVRKIQSLSGKAYLGDQNAADELLKVLMAYFSGREWSLPNITDFSIVHEANELLAWTLLFGRIPNHFAISAHLLVGFNTFEEFIMFIDKELQLSLNNNGGIIKGSQSQGIRQASTNGKITQTQLADGYWQLPAPFIEFVWRYSKVKENPKKWRDYYTGFISQNANRVVESLYIS